MRRAPVLDTERYHALTFSMALLGRESEMTACLAALGRPRIPAGIVIVGEPGIGKTALFRAVVNAAAQLKCRVLVTTGLSGEVDVPQTNLADLLDPTAREVLAQLPTVQAHALRVALRSAPATSPVDDTVIARATVNVLRALAGERLLIAVDDEQWLDPDTRRVLITAITWLTDVPITWLVSVRTARADAGLAPILAHELTPSLTRVDLAMLNEDALDRLIQERFPGRWSPQLISRICEVSAGNPYTALELARETLASAGRDVAVVQVPGSLAGSLNARLQRLGPDVLTVVQVAAVPAHPTREMLRTIVGAQADAAIDVALEADVLKAIPPDPVMQFTHPLLREVALASLTWPQRRELHRALADAVQDPAEAAGHLAAGADEPDEDIAAVVEDAAERVACRGAPVRAAALAEAALALTPDPAGQSAWHRRIRVVDYLERASERDRARALAEKWSAANPPDEVRGRLTFFRGVLADDWNVHMELIAEAVGLLDHDPVFAAHAGALLAHELTGSWRYPEAQVHAERAVGNARRAGAPEVLRWALAVEADLAARSGDPGAEAMLREAVALPGWEDMWIPVFSPEMALACWHLGRGDLDPARQLMHLVLDASERHDRAYGPANVLGLLGWLEWAAGRWDQAEQHARHYDRYTRIAFAKSSSDSKALLHLVSASRGHTDEARVGLREALHLANRDRDNVLDTLIRGDLGRLELSVDDPAAAVAWLDPIAALLPVHVFGDPAMIVIPADLIEGYARAGRTGEASRLLDWLQEAADRMDNPWAQITSGRAAAVLHLATSDPKAAAAALEPIVIQARERQLPLELGRCLLVLGTAQRRTRRRRTAAHTLDEAIRVFGELGAQRWAELARAERARLTHTADDLLTPAEQRIAELVAQGRTNAEIAATLLVTVKTVEGTLTRIYRKLGARSRVDLARRAAT